VKSSTLATTSLQVNASAARLGACDSLVRLATRRDMYEHIKACALSEGVRLSVVAEVGVWRGSNAQALWEVLRPNRLILVDAWLETSDPRYVAANEQIVSDKFTSQVASGAVVLFKGTSMQWLAKQLNSSIDMLYLDTQHSYHQTHLELIRAARVVAPTGYLCGHDFGHPSGGMVYGVIEAVVDFALEYEWELLAVSLTDAPYRSFCIKRLPRRGQLEETLG